MAADRRDRARGWPAVLMTAAILASGWTGASPAHAGEPDPMSVGVVGDSIAHEARDSIDAIVAAGRPLVHRDTRNAYTMADIHDATVTAVTAPDGPDILVLVMGTAQTNLPFWPYESTPPVVVQWTEDLTRLLDAVTPHVECVRVFDVQERRTFFYLGVDEYGRLVNARTRQIVQDYTNVDWFHYAAWADRAGPAYDWGDGLHHNIHGQEAVARMIADAADGCDPTTAGAPFWDVSADHWAAESIAWAATEGLVSGYPNGSFQAEIDRIRVEITRAQVVSMLWSEAGQPDASALHPWHDGRPWVDPALDWAAEVQAISGWPDGSVRPDAPITRAEAARLVWRLSGSPSASNPHGWSDGLPWVDPALDWLAETGLMTGWPDGTFRPGEDIGRAAMVRLVHRWSLLDAPETTLRPAQPQVDASGPPTTHQMPASSAPDTTASTTIAPTTVPAAPTP